MTHSFCGDLRFPSHEEEKSFIQAKISSSARLPITFGLVFYCLLVCAVNAAFWANEAHNPISPFRTAGLVVTVLIIVSLVIFIIAFNYAAISSRFRRKNASPFRTELAWAMVSLIFLLLPYLHLIGDLSARQQDFGNLFPSPFLLSATILSWASIYLPIRARTSCVLAAFGALLACIFAIALTCEGHTFAADAVVSVAACFLSHQAARRQETQERLVHLHLASVSASSFEALVPSNNDSNDPCFQDAIASLPQEADFDIPGTPIPESEIVTLSEGIQHDGHSRTASEVFSLAGSSGDMLLSPTSVFSAEGSSGELAVPIPALSMDASVGASGRLSFQRRTFVHISIQTEAVDHAVTEVQTDIEASPSLKPPLLPGTDSVLRDFNIRGAQPRRSRSRSRSRGISADGSLQNQPQRSSDDDSEPRQSESSVSGDDSQDLQGCFDFDELQGLWVLTFPEPQTMPPRAAWAYVVGGEVLHADGSESDLEWNNGTVLLKDGPLSRSGDFLIRERQDKSRMVYVRSPPAQVPDSVHDLLVAHRQNG